MQTIAITKLKAHLSAELKRVRAGEILTILDHNTPVAQLVPLPRSVLLSKAARKKPEYQPLSPLLRSDALLYLDQERED